MPSNRAGSTNSKKLRQIKKNFEYIKYLNSAGIHYQTTNSDEIRICCPICDETDYKCYVNDIKKTFICFRCEAGRWGNGDVFTLVSAVESIPIGAVISRMLSHYRDVTPDDFEFEDIDEEIELDEKPSYLDIKPIEALPSCAKLIDDSEKAAPYLQYCLDRGLTKEEVLSMQTRYIHFGRIDKDGNKVDISKRVLWPVYSEVGLTSWLARSVIKDLPKHKPKYFNSPHSDMAKCVWPHLARPVNVDSIVVVEGLLDAVAVRRTDSLAVCTFGKKLSPTQIDLLEYWGYANITIFFDLGAGREAIGAAEKLRHRFKDVKIADNLDWPAGQDSGDLLKHPNGVQILQEALDKAVSINNEWEMGKWLIRLKSM